MGASCQGSCSLSLCAADASTALASSASAPVPAPATPSAPSTPTAGKAASAPSATPTSPVSPNGVLAEATAATPAPPEVELAVTWKDAEAQLAEPRSEAEAHKAAIKRNKESAERAIAEANQQTQEKMKLVLQERHQEVLAGFREEMKDTSMEQAKVAAYSRASYRASVINPSIEESFLSDDEELEEELQAQVQRAQSSGKMIAGESTRFGKRAKVAVHGTLADLPEKPFDMKKQVFHGISCAEELAEGEKCAVKCTQAQMPWNFIRPNQDNYFYIVTVDGYRFCGVLDGHGKDGHRVASAASALLIRSILAELPIYSHHEKERDAADAVNHALEYAFEYTQEKLEELHPGRLDLTLSGTAAMVLLHHTRRNRLHVAWVGDCRCVAAELHIEEDIFAEPGKGKKKKRVVTKPLTRDHTTIRLEERERILAGGAQLRPRETKTPAGRASADEIYFPNEEWPGLPLTRCLGNLVAKQLGVTHEPEIIDRTIGAAGADQELMFAAIATDGIFAAVSDSDVVHCLAEAGKGDSNRGADVQYCVDNACGKAREAWEKHDALADCVDDITLLALWF